MKPDIALHDLIVEVKAGVKATRSLHQPLLELASMLLDRGERNGVLLLDDPELTDHRILSEWHRLRPSLRPDLAERMSVVILRGGDIVTPIAHDLRKRVLHALESERSERMPHRRGNHFDVFRILVNRWLLREEPIAIQSLARGAGCSHPTVTTALGRILRWIHRTSDRKVALTDFPKDEWAKLIAASDRVRSSVAFVDKSASPRSARMLLERLHGLRLPRVSVGGVSGAKFHAPELDIAGMPRVDLTLHAPQGNPSLRFVGALDAALEPAGSESPSLVVHIDRQVDPLVHRTAESADVWAPPVDCLMDLHSARLEYQAEDFVRLMRAHG